MGTGIRSVKPEILRTGREEMPLVCVSLFHTLSTLLGVLSNIHIVPPSMTRLPLNFVVKLPLDNTGR